jgi:hypothetical protein
MLTAVVVSRHYHPDVYGNKQDAEGEEVLFMVNPGMRL